jgi:hypothetical protein
MLESCKINGLSTAAAIGCLMANSISCCSHWLLCGQQHQLLQPLAAVWPTASAAAAIGCCVANSISCCSHWLLCGQWHAKGTCC